MCPRPERLEAWKRLASDLPAETLATLTREIALEDTISAAPKFLSGEIRGRVIVPIAPDLT